MKFIHPIIKIGILHIVAIVVEKHILSPLIYYIKINMRNSQITCVLCYLTFRNSIVSYWYSLLCIVILYDDKKRDIHLNNKYNEHSLSKEEEKAKFL